MKLYVMRHGHSLGVAEAKVAGDAERPLSEKGREGVGRTMRGLIRRGGKPSLVLHSPLKRAAQTALAAAELLKPSTIELFRPLANILSAAELLVSLQQRCAGVSEALAIGHQPQVGELTLLLCGDIHEFLPGTLVAFELEGQAARFLWTCGPDDGA